MMMKNTIAKLLAEEDIFVVHKQMDTAYFDVKNRELGLPIWKQNTIDPIEEEPEQPIPYKLTRGKCTKRLNPDKVPDGRSSINL